MSIFFKKWKENRRRTTKEERINTKKQKTERSTTENTEVQNGGRREDRHGDPPAAGRHGEGEKQRTEIFRDAGERR